MKLAIIIGVVVILFVVFILASYIKAPTDRALIVSGLRKNPKFVIGKSALRIPFLQRVDKLELKMISVDVKTKESVPTNEYINVNIDSAVKIKVGSSKEMLEKAASNFLNKNEDYIINFIDITPRFLPVFAEKFSFEYLRKSHKIPLFSNKLVTPGYTRIRSSL